MTAPFRWKIERGSEVAGLVRNLPAPALDGWLSELRHCAARVLALSRDSDLVFVGRSPENLHDYLNGALAATSWAARLSHLNISLRAVSNRTLKMNYAEKIEFAKEHFRELGLDPESLIHRERPIALVDLVCHGWTFESLDDFLESWAVEERADLPAMRRKLRFLAITSRSDPMSRSGSWLELADWLDEFPRDAVRTAPIDYSLWDSWGNVQSKTVRSNPPQQWGTADLQRPPHWKENLEALRLAVSLFQKGREKDERRELARVVCAQPEMRNGWLRKLVGELRGTRARRAA